MSTNRELTFAEAIREAIYQELKRDERVFVMGEDVGFEDGAFRVTSGFLKEFGRERIRDTPISEAGFLGAGVATAILGLRPIVELMFADFTGVAMDQIYNQAGKLRYMSGGQVKIPLVIRMAMGGGLSAAAQHSQCLYSVFAHLPGLKIVLPSNSYDAKGLMISSIRADDPVMYFEHKALYDRKLGHVPQESYEIPLGKADVKRSGNDVTVVATAMMVHKALDAAQQLESDGISVEVIDPRTIVPLDKIAIFDSVKKTGRIVIVDEDYLRCGFAAEVSALIADDGFDLLDAPVKRVATYNVPIPFSPVLEEVVLPSTERIKTAVREVVQR
jgi:pyruvate/2-oxoglutarate/acetoin dehydrogenase E1 component